MTERNYAAEMRAVMDAETGEGPYHLAVVANQIVEKLRATDPDLLDGWLQAQAVTFVHEAIRSRDRSDRGHARATATRSVFRAAAESAEAGDEAPLAKFLSTVYVVEDGSRVRLAEMRKPELIFVADDYRQRASEHLLQEAFMRALAKKVGKDRVADHFDDAQLTAMWQSITSR